MRRYVKVVFKLGSPLIASVLAVTWALPQTSVSNRDRAESWNVPVAIKKLPNGLRVVVSEDHSAPRFGLCVSYGIGFRLEPEGRTGFAHLFEYMMFEGTPNAPKGTLDRVIEGRGDSPFSRVQPYAETGILTTSADVRNPVTGASFNEITYELKSIATSTPEEQELDGAKRYLIGSQAIRLQSREAVARSLAEIWVDSLPPEELGRESRDIQKVAAKDVEAARRKYFPAHRMTVVAVVRRNWSRTSFLRSGSNFNRFSKIGAPIET